MIAAHADATSGEGINRDVAFDCKDYREHPLWEHS